MFVYLKGAKDQPHQKQTGHFFLLLYNNKQKKCGANKHNEYLCHLLTIIITKLPHHIIYTVVGVRWPLYAKASKHMHVNAQDFKKYPASYIYLALYQAHLHCDHEIITIVNM